MLPNILQGQVVDIGILVPYSAGIGYIANWERMPIISVSHARFQKEWGIPPKTRSTLA